MFTRCPHCETVFRIQPEQLRVAHGKVRCSECNQVFNALEDLRPSGEPEPEPPRLEERADPIPSAERQAASAGEAAMPSSEGRPVGMTEAAPTDEGHHELLEDLSSQLGSPGATVNGPLLAPPFPRPSIAQRVAWGFANLLLLLVALAQLVWWLRDPLLDRSEGRQAAEWICSIADCVVPPRRDTSRFAILQRSVSSHPTLPDTLQIAIRFANQAPFPQPYPLLRVTFYGEDGSIKVRRALRPDEYLMAGLDPGMLAAGGEVQVNLDALDPGEGVTGFEFEFF